MLDHAAVGPLRDGTVSSHKHAPYVRGRRTHRRTPHIVGVPTIHSATGFGTSHAFP